MNDTDRHVLAALRATGGSITVAELGYQMTRRNRPAVSLPDVQASLERLQIGGHTHQPYATLNTWSATARAAA